MGVELITSYDTKILESKLKKADIDYEIIGGKIYIKGIDTKPLQNLSNILVDDILIDWEGNLLLYSEMSKKRL